MIGLIVSVVMGMLRMVVNMRVRMLMIRMVVMADIRLTMFGVMGVAVTGFAVVVVMMLMMLMIVRLGGLRRFGVFRLE